MSSAWYSLFQLLSLISIYVDKVAIYFLLLDPIDGLTSLAQIKILKRGLEFKESPIISDHAVNDQPEQMLLDQVPKICPMLPIPSLYNIFRENAHTFRRNTIENDMHV